MGILMLTEIGFWQLFWNFSAWELSVMLYGCVAAGFLIELIFLLKCRRAAVKRAFLALVILALIACECAYHLAAGWDEVAILFVYGGVLGVLLGAVLAVLLSKIWKKR